MILKDFQATVRFENAAGWNEATDDTTSVVITIKVETYDIKESLALSREVGQWIEKKCREGKEHAPNNAGLTGEELVKAIENQTRVKYWPVLNDWCYPKVGTLKNNYRDGFREGFRFESVDGRFDESVPLAHLAIVPEDADTGRDDE